MNIRDIKEKTIEELLQMLPTVERQLSDARFSLGKIKTVIHERKAR